MKTKQVNISDLIFADYNPRLLTEKQHRDLKKSVKEFGLVEPIVVNEHPDRKNIIVGGHQRVKVAKELKFKEVPVAYVNLDEEREKELNIRLNKNGGQWDMDLLANYFDNMELLDWGFQDWELGIHNSELEVPQDIADFEEEKEPTTEDVVKGEYSKFELIMKTPNKTALIEKLNLIRAENDIKKQEDALMLLVNKGVKK